MDLCSCPVQPSTPHHTDRGPLKQYSENERNCANSLLNLHSGPVNVGVVETQTGHLRPERGLQQHQYSLTRPPHPPCPSYLHLHSTPVNENAGLRPQFSQSRHPQLLPHHGRPILASPAAVPPGAPVGVAAGAVGGPSSTAGLGGSREALQVTFALRKHLM